MAKEWKKVEIVTERGERVLAQAPVIVSASRATDIPAFYADWFMERLRKGYLRWTNPFNGKPLYVSFAKTRAIVFWTKNPQPILRHLDELKERGLNFYFQYTLNDYDDERLEPNVLSVEQRIKTFQALSDTIGTDRVIWRFDPLLITDKTPIDVLFTKVCDLAERLKGMTRRLVFSFADIMNYRSVGSNLKKAGFCAREFTHEEKLAFAQRLSEANKRNGWGLTLATCAEDIDLEKYGIEHNRCIDDRLLIRNFSHDVELMEFLGVSPQLDLFSEPKKDSYSQLKDKGQRLACGCIRSKDIGEYNTCPHRCLYCYANTSPGKAVEHAKNALKGETITL